VGKPTVHEGTTAIIAVTHGNSMNALGQYWKNQLSGGRLDKKYFLMGVSYANVTILGRTSSGWKLIGPLCDGSHLGFDACEIED